MSTDPDQRPNVDGPDPGAEVDDARAQAAAEDALEAARAATPDPPADVDTYWNGQPCKAERVKVIVGDTGRFRHYWAREQGLVGTVRNAVRVELEHGDPFYLDDEHGGGWAKVTAGKGSPQFSSQSLDVERELTPDEDPEQRIREAAGRNPDVEPLGERDYLACRRGIFAIAQAAAPMPVEMVDRCIKTAELALAAQPLLGDAGNVATDNAHGGLDLELKMFRAFRAYLARLAAVRVDAEQRAAEIHDAAQAAPGNGERPSGLVVPTGIVVPEHATRTQEDPNA